MDRDSAVGGERADAQPVLTATSEGAKTSLGHLPAKPKWEFDGTVTEVFEDMLERSIPALAEMRRLVTDVASEFLADGGGVLDLGCSRGGALAPLVERHGQRCWYKGVEVSEPMRRAAMARFSGSRESVEIVSCDLRENAPWLWSNRYRVTLAILTLQFIPIEHRARILAQAYEATKPGGALIVVEKVIASSATMHQLLTGLYHERKRANGYSDEEIRRKALSLEGVLVPMTARWNEDMLRDAGFAHVECFWRALSFAWWVAVKR